MLGDSEAGFSPGRIQSVLSRWWLPWARKQLVFCSRGPKEQRVWLAFVTLSEPHFFKAFLLILKSNITDKRSKQHLLFEGHLTGGRCGESGGGGLGAQTVSQRVLASALHGVGSGFRLNEEGRFGARTSMGKHVEEPSEPRCPVTA